MMAAVKAFVEQRMRGAKEQHNRGRGWWPASRAAALGQLQKSSILDTPLPCSQDGIYALYPV